MSEYPNTVRLGQDALFEDPWDGWGNIGSSLGTSEGFNPQDPGVLR